MKSGSQPRSTHRCLWASLKVSEVNAVTGRGAAGGGSDPCAQAGVGRLLGGDLSLGVEDSVSLQDTRAWWAS